MAFMAVLESDLRALSAEARRRHPAVKDAAEHGILKLRSLSGPNEIAQNEDILQIFLMACDVRSVKLSVIGLSCLQKLISHDAVEPSALKNILLTLKDHADINDDNVQLKTLQTVLIIFQSRLQPESEENMAQALGICLHLLENGRSSDSVRNTAAATFRQAVALIFDNVVRAESLPALKNVSGGQLSRSSSVTYDVSRNINQAASAANHCTSGQAQSLRGCHSTTGPLGIRLLEDLTALAAGGSALWLHVHSLQRTFALEIIEFILSNYVAVFQNLDSYEQVLRHQICSLLMTSLRTNVEVEGEANEPSFRRLVLRSVGHVIRLYSFSLVTECEVFLNMLMKITRLDLPSWHRILALEILRGFCVEARTLRLLFQNFDMNPKNTNVVENIVKALALVVSTIQVPDSSEESLVAVAGMFNSKAKGVEWSMDNDASNTAVLIASEAHAITLAVEGLLGVVFTIATLTDEAVDVGELESPKGDMDESAECKGETSLLCLSMVNSTWLTILDALSLILARSQGEAIVLEILKGYQAYTQACGVLHAVEPLNSFLASLCKFTINIPNEGEKRSVLTSPGSKKSEPSADQREHIVLTPKNVQALRTLFNVAHRLHNVLGSSWVLVLETLAALDRAIHSPHASTQEISTSVSRLARETAGQYTDFHILSSLNSQLFESSALMHISAVKALLSALWQLSSQFSSGSMNVIGQPSIQQISTVVFSVERMTTILVNNLHRVEPIWDGVVGHLVELADNSNPHLRNLALDALDKSICAVIGSDRFHSAYASEYDSPDSQVMHTDAEIGPFECAVLSPLFVLYKTSQSIDVRSGALKILLHVLERHGDKLYYSWPNILDILRAVAGAPDKELVPLGFQILRIIMNEGLSSIPVQCLDVCIDVTGSYSAQKTELNISLTAIGLLWTATDFIVRGLVHQPTKELLKEVAIPEGKSVLRQSKHAENSEHERSLYTTTEQTVHRTNEASDHVPASCWISHDKLLLSVFSILQKLAADERPEVRNSAIRTLFQTLGSHGHKLSRNMWEDCLWDYVFPVLDRVICLAATSSKDEWQGKELGIRGGKAVHMLIHHSRNTAQKQWDETIVLVLGGITRLLRSFFPFLQSLNNFTTGWELLLNFITDSISNGSKEVALAALNCLQTTISAHCSKGSFPVDYLKSVLKVYECVTQQPPKHWSSATNKVKEEILRNLGDLYLQAQMMFDSDMYLMLLAIIKYAFRDSNNTGDSEYDYGNLSLVQRNVLEILPMLRPPKHLPTMWSQFFNELLCCLLGFEAPIDADPVQDFVDLESLKLSNKETEKVMSTTPADVTATFMIKTREPLMQSGPCSQNDKLATIFNGLFVEKFIPVLIELYLEAPPVEKCTVVPEFIKLLGRCMSTRRDHPQGVLWKVAVESFNRILVDEINKVHMDCKIQPTSHKLARAHFWKDVADVYETFLVGSCGRALSSEAPSEALKADELIEMNVLGVLGNKVLKAQLDAPLDILQRLIATLDRCASRTGSLPVESVGLIPPHCSRFSLSCLQMMFSLCSYDWHPQSSEVSRISIGILMHRCENILHQFLTDENDMGKALGWDRPLPAARLDEVVCILQELGRLVIHPDTSSVLNMSPRLRHAASQNRDLGVRTHLLILFPSFCELVISRESRVRELVQVLLRLVSSELGLQKSLPTT